MGNVIVTPFSLLVWLGKRTKKDERIQSIWGMCAIPSYWRRGYATGSSMYSESDRSLCVRLLRYAIPGESTVWSACCCCLFAQLAQLCVCVCRQVHCSPMSCFWFPAERSWCTACHHFSMATCVLDSIRQCRLKFVVIASWHLACGTVLWSGESISSARVRKVAFSVHRSRILIALSIAQESTAAQCIPIACHFVVRRWLVCSGNGWK